MPVPLHRIICFVADVQKCARFYIDVFGFKPVVSADPPDDWIELDTGRCRLAFHRRGSAKRQSRGPHKIVFFAKNVKLARGRLIARGAKMGPAKRFAKLVLCDGKDPAGNAFQISNRA